MKNARNNIRPLASPAMPVNAQYNQSFFFSSDTKAGAQNVSSDGTRFSVQLADPIAIPDGALACELGVVTASIWNNSPNIGPGLGPPGVDDNNFQYTTSTAPAGTYSITLPTGLYSLAAISSYMSSRFVNNGHAANLFSLSGQAAATITTLTLGDTARCEQAGTIGSILGFPSAAIVSTIANQVSFGTTIATLNRNNTYLISGDLIAGGIPVNSSASGLIATIPIVAVPGEQINYTAQNVLWTPARELVGTLKSGFSFWLTNERGEATPTACETWSFTLIIRFVR